MIKLTVLTAVAWMGCAGASPPPVTPAAPPPVIGDDWGAMRMLAGRWVGDGGGFTLAPELGGKILVRRGTNDLTGKHHEDLTIIYRAANQDLQATYFDNEGHTIHYEVTADGPSITFLSDEAANQPRFRLTYASAPGHALAISFDIAPPGATEFHPYLKGTVHAAQ